MNGRVVITGLGIVSAIGVGKDTFWNNLIKGKSGISEVTLFDTSNFSCHYAAEIKDFNSQEFIPGKMDRFFGRASQFAIAATGLALEDALIPKDEVKNRKTAVIMGATIPEGTAVDFFSEMVVEKQFASITSEILMSVYSPSTPRNVGYFFKMEGLNLLLPNACAAGNFSVGYGFDLIKRGKVDLAIAGGSEALSRIAYQGFQQLYAMAPDVCSPFDKNRKGLLLGEGSGILVMEPLEKALERGARIYAEILGYGASCDAYHMTRPKKEGIKKAMEKALNNSNVSVADIDYISAHGTGTIQNDKTEVAAINEVFGQRYKQIPASSIKSMLGHCMGAASSMEAVACCLALKNGKIPPTINFETPDPECFIDCVPNQSRKAKLRVVLNNGFAFGGNNCCVVLADYAG